MKTKEELTSEYFDYAAPLFGMMFPMMHSIAIMASKLECKAYKCKLRMSKDTKRDFAQIEQTAKRLKQLCDMYQQKYLFTNKTNEDEKDMADMVILNDSNLYLYYMMMLQNMLASGATSTDLAKLDTTYKLLTKNTHKFGMIPNETIAEFRL